MTNEMQVVPKVTEYGEFDWSVVPRFSAMGQQTRNQL